MGLSSRASSSLSGRRGLTITLTSTRLLGSTGPSASACTSARRHSAGHTRERGEQLRTVGATQPGARVPTEPGVEAIVVAPGDVGKRAAGTAQAVERRVHEADRLAELLVEQRG